MENLKLIDGKFTPADAKEILLNMISSKIQFHTVKDFSSGIRTGEPIMQSRERIAELKESKKKIIAVIEEAEKENSEVEIYASIIISCTGKTRAL